MADNIEKTNERIITTLIDEQSAGKRLDIYLSTRFTYNSRNQWQNSIKQGEITLNGKKTKGSVKLRSGDKIEFTPNFEEPNVDKNFQIIYEDEYLLAVNKSGNIPCHPAGPFFKNTLWYELTNVAKVAKNLHFINRIDRETSGLVLIAKDPETTAKFAEKELISLKRYQALVFGNFQSEIIAEGYLFSDTSISHNSSERVRKKRFFAENKPKKEEFETSKTILKSIRSFEYKTAHNMPDHVSLIEAELFTGRMHQIRATLCSLGFPLLGDKLYGPDESIFLRFIQDQMSIKDQETLILSRQALHSAEMIFTHPHTKKEIKLIAPLPNDMQQIIM